MHTDNSNMNTPDKDTDGRNLEITLQKEINRLIKENTTIECEYNTESYDTFIIRREVVERRKKFLKELLTLAELQPNHNRNTDFSRSFSTLKKSYNSLDTSYPQKAAYEEFVKTATEELVELRERQLELWGEIENALQEYEPQKEKKEIPRTPEDQIYVNNYNQFFSDLTEFLSSNDVFADNKPNIKELLKKYSDYISTSKISAEEKRTIFRNIIASCVLREMIYKISRDIDINQMSVLSELFLDIYRTMVETYILYEATVLDNEEYKANPKTRDASQLFWSIDEDLESLDYYMLGAILEVNTEKAQKKIRSKYKAITLRIERLIEWEKTPDIRLPSKFHDNIDILLQYNNSVIDTIVKIIESNVYSAEQKQESASLFKLQNGS